MQTEKKLPYLFVIGGKYEKDLKVSEYFDSSKNEWIPFNSLKIERSFHQASTIASRILVTGGNSENRILSAVEVYNPYIDQWELCKPMNVKRSEHGMATLDGSVYVSGGKNMIAKNANPINSVERFDPFVNKWTQQKPMNEARYSFQMVQLNGCLYSFGNNPQCNSEATMERFDPREGTWKYVAPMGHELNQFGATVYNGEIYAFGFKAHHRYNPRQNSWDFENVDKMKWNRYNLQVVTMGDELYALSGNGGRNKNTHKKVDIYNPVNDYWEDGKDLTTAREGYGAVVIARTELEMILGNERINKIGQYKMDYADGDKMEM